MTPTSKFALKKIDGTDNWRSIFSDYNGTLDLLETALVAKAMMPSTAIPIPSSSKSYTMAGLTADHRVWKWQFSDSAENSPPCDLTITTYNGYFTVTNTNGDSTTETIQPIFTVPTAIAVTARD